MLDDTLRQRIDQEVGSNDVVLFMKGTPVFPQCGFSAVVVQVLSHLGVKFKRSEEHTSELQSLMRISYAVFCLKKKKKYKIKNNNSSIYIKKKQTQLTYEGNIPQEKVYTI